MILNNLVQIAKNLWMEIPEHFKNVGLDEFKVMPNHGYRIVIFVGNAYMRSLQSQQTYVNIEIRR